MSSPFESALTGDNHLQRRLRDTLWSYVDTESLSRLRATSRVLSQHVEDTHGRLFRDLHVHYPLRSGSNLVNLEGIAQHCRNLTLIIGQPKFTQDAALDKAPIRRIRFPLVGSFFNDRRRSSVADTRAPTTPVPSFTSQSVISEDVETDRKVWEYLLSRFTALESVALRIHGDTGWPGHTGIEANVVAVRILLESISLTNLHTFVLSPVHTSGIIHLRWSSFGAFNELPRDHRFWRNITKLCIDLHNPAAVVAPGSAVPRITPAQNLMFLKILHSYLRSFSPTLHHLRFTWLDTPGPSPLLLYREPSLAPTIPPIHWPMLTEFWFGNITLPYQTIRLLPDHAPNVTTVKALRSTHRFSQGDTSNDEAWINVPLHAPLIGRGDPAYTASSIYSQCNLGNIDEMLGEESAADEDSDRGRMLERVVAKEHERTVSAYVSPRKGWRRLTDSRSSLLLPRRMRKGR